MKISYNWLKELTACPQTPAQIADILTMAGFESTAPQGGGGWSSVITAKVTTVEKHPNADKLRLCDVTDGSNTYKIVCGAPNVAVGQTIALAVLGAVLPGDFKIEPRTIRGVASQGMICSEKELGLPITLDGIMVLPADTPLGKPLESVIDNDTILDVETTTSRPDCLNHWGVAREIAAYCNTHVAYPALPPRTMPSGLSITVEQLACCPRYIGVKVRNIVVKPSPRWLAARLEACGLRPINNIVDITNYVLLETGHPLHAFDAAQMKGQSIVVRMARPAESIHALNGKTYSLTESMLVIADTEKPQAIAGIIGGEHSGVTEGTTDIILESAVFDPVSIRKTSRALALSTDSSYRFERRCSWDMAYTASQRALGLILELAGGSIESSADVIAAPRSPITVTLRPERAERILGVSIPTETMVSLLNRLELPAQNNNGVIAVMVPSWRNDIRLEADLIEEVARLHGYNAIPTTVLPVIPRMGEDAAIEPIENILRSRLLPLGFSEGMNYSFSSAEQLRKYGFEPAEIVVHPLSQDAEALRPALFPGLMQSLFHNIAHGYKTIRLFEVGNVFTAANEHQSLGIIAYGSVFPENWKYEEYGFSLQTMDYYTMKGIITALTAGNACTITTGDMPPHYLHPGKAASIVINGKKVGFCGVVHPGVIADITGDVLYAELDLTVMNWNYKPPKYQPLKPYPPVKRDLSLVADAGLSYERIIEEIKKLQKRSASFAAVFEDIVLFSKYQDEKLGAGKVSYSFHVILRHSEHTLSDAEVQGAVTELLTALKDTLAMTLRS